MGCRLFACLTIVVIICLELLINIVAIPANYGQNSDLAEIPIHKRAVKSDIIEFNENDATAGIDIYTFTAEPGQELTIKFKQINIEFPADDVINIYSGAPEVVIDKSKTTEVQATITQAAFKQQTKRMPLLISSKRASGAFNQENVLIQTDQFYTADSNELTVMFNRNSFGTSGFTALVEARPIPESDSMLRRASRDGAASSQSDASFARAGYSFELCKILGDGLESNAGKVEKSNANRGTVTSHTEYNPDVGIDDAQIPLDYKDMTCSHEIESEGPIKISVRDMKLSDYDPSCAANHLEIQDLAADSSVMNVKLCDSDDIGTWEFSNNIKLTLKLGAFLSDAGGFLLQFNGTKDAKKEIVKDLSKPNKQEKLIQTQLDDEEQKVIITEESEESESSNKAPQNEVNKATNSQQKQSGGDLNGAQKPMPAILIVSTIVVAILLIIILSAAGAIACYRNYQQEKIINSMHERLSDIHGPGYTPVDGSHNSLSGLRKNTAPPIQPSNSQHIVVQKTPVLDEQSHKLLPSSPESSESKSSAK